MHHVILVTRLGEIGLVPFENTTHFLLQWGLVFYPWLFSFSHITNCLSYLLGLTFFCDMLFLWEPFIASCSSSLSLWISKVETTNKFKWALWTCDMQNVSVLSEAAAYRRFRISILWKISIYRKKTLRSERSWKDVLCLRHWALNKARRTYKTNSKSTVVLLNPTGYFAKNTPWLILYKLLLRSCRLWRRQGDPEMHHMLSKTTKGFVSKGLRRNNHIQYACVVDAKKHDNWPFFFGCGDSSFL